MIREMVVSRKITLPAHTVDTLNNRLDELIQNLQTCPKTARWKIRSLMGKRISWYEEVEEVRR